MFVLFCSFFLKEVNYALDYKRPYIINIHCSGAATVATCIHLQRPWHLLNMLVLDFFGFQIQDIQDNLLPLDDHFL